MANLDEATQLQYLRDEYLFLQAQYEDYDKRSLTIKGWVGAGAAAALAVAFSGKSYSYFVPLMVAVIVITVWYIEAYWKLFQYALADRIRVIEAHFRGDPDILIKNPAPFQIYSWWFKGYSDEPIYEYERTGSMKRPQPWSTRLRAAASQRFVYLPYLPIIILCIISFVLLVYLPATASP